MIKLGTYPLTLVSSDFTVQLLDDTNSTFTKDLYIMSVDNSAKTITVKFGGAHSGDYHVMVTSLQFGRLTNSNLALKVESKVTSISPVSGSMYGGTLVTIIGTNFSTNPLDNPVKIGDNYCLVETTSAT